eukprot:1891100-Prymnesium_polylepis.1
MVFSEISRSPGVRAIASPPLACTPLHPTLRTAQRVSDEWRPLDITTPLAPCKATVQLSITSEVALSASTPSRRPWSTCNPRSVTDDVFDSSTTGPAATESTGASVVRSGRVLAGRVKLLQQIRSVEARALVDVVLRTRRVELQLHRRVVLERGGSAAMAVGPVDAPVAVQPHVVVAHPVPSVPARLGDVWQIRARVEPEMAEANLVACRPPVGRGGGGAH